MSIYIALKVAPKHVKGGLLNHISDDAARAMAKHIGGKLNIVEAIAEDVPLDKGV
ncbi:MAG: hypothetical protein WBD37_02270 [Anderseniella sp.]